MAYFSFSFLKDQSQAGTLAALVAAKKKLEKIFFYTNADEISLFDIRQMYISFCTQEALITALVKKDINGYLTVNQQLIYKKKRIGEGTHIELGSKFVKIESLNLAASNHEKFEEYIYNILISKERVTYYEIDLLPTRIDTVHDLKIAKKFLQKNSIT